MKGMPLKSDLVITTFDCVPKPPRGLVRALRIRWALEEVGLLYQGPRSACLLNAHLIDEVGHER